MKTTIFLFLIVTVFLGVSCKDKDLKCNTDTSWPVLAEASPEELEFVGIAAHYQGRDTIENGEVVNVEDKVSFRLTQYGGDNCVSNKQIAVVNIPKVVGDTVFLVPSSDSLLSTTEQLIATRILFSLLDDDAIVATYYLLPPEVYTSWILIDWIGESGEIFGQFRLGFEVADGFSRSNVEIYGLPEIIKLTNGEFKARRLE